MKDCPVCLNIHDPEIHRATVRVHRWFRQRLKSIIRPPVTGKHRPRGTRPIRERPTSVSFKQGAE